MPDFKEEYKNICRTLSEGKINADVANYETAKLNAWATKLKSQWRANAPELTITPLVIAVDYQQLVENHQSGRLSDGDFQRECSKLLALCESSHIKFPGSKELVDAINLAFISESLDGDLTHQQPATTEPTVPQHTGALPDDGFDDEYADLEDEDEFEFEYEDSEPYQIGVNQAGGYTVELWNVSSEETETIIKADGSEEQFDIRDGGKGTQMFLQYYKAAGYPMWTDEEIIAIVKETLASYEKMYADSNNYVGYQHSISNIKQSLQPENVAATIAEHRLDEMITYAEDQLYGG